MKISNIKIYLIAGIAFLVSFSCSDDKLDEINANPNAPINVPISLLLPQATISAIEGITGFPGGVYSGLFVEHVTNVHLNPRLPIEASGVFNSTYAVLNDLKIIIEKGSDGGSEEGQYAAVGIAKIMYAYTLSIATDLFGDIPHSEALQGSDIRQPKFDTQESLYTFLQERLDEAIVDLDRTSIGSVERIDLIYSGNTDLWKKTAYALKARLYNRLSNRDPQGSAQNALNALANAYSDPNESLIFDGYLPGNANDNPWTARQKSQQLYAVSTTMIDLMEENNDPDIIDPRAEIWFTKINDEFVGAPPADAETDLTHTIYSSPSNATVLFDAAPQPVITYDEMKFIEAEANLRLGNTVEANDAYEEAVVAAMERAGVTTTDITAYTGQGDVFPGSGNLTLDHVIKQKYISLWMFQSIEAFNDYRRTGIPTMQNFLGTPLRVPYPIDELSRNANAPTNINEVTIFTTPVWWQ